MSLAVTLLVSLAYSKARFFPDVVHTRPVRHAVCISLLDAPAPEYDVGQVVRVEVLNFSPLGCNVMVEGAHDGLVFANEMRYPPNLGTLTKLPLRRGDLLEGYVQKLRDDGKVDVALRKLGFAKAEASRSAVLLALLQAKDGCIPLGDASPADKIQGALALSKVQFKNAIGSLWKAGIIERPGPLETKLAPGEGQSKAGGVAKESLASANSAIVFVQGLPFDATAQDIVDHIYAHAPTAPDRPPPRAGVHDDWLLSIRGLEQPDGRASGRAWLKFADAADAAAILNVARSAGGGPRAERAAPRSVETEADEDEDEDEGDNEEEKMAARLSDEGSDALLDGPATEELTPAPLLTIGGRRLEFFSLDERQAKQAYRQHAIAGPTGPAGGQGGSPSGGSMLSDAVFVANLPFDTSEDEIRNLFGACGEIRRVRCAVDRETGRFKGFAHVYFWDSAAAGRAVAFSGRRFAGREVRIEYARESAGRPPARRWEEGDGRGSSDWGSGRAGTHPYARPAGREGRRGGRGGRGRRPESRLDRRAGRTDSRRNAEGSRGEAPVPPYRVVKFLTSDFDVSRE